MADPHEVMTPDVLIEARSSVSYTAGWITQEPASITATVVVGYTPPNSMAGMPSVLVRAQTRVLYTPPSVYDDIEGSTTFTVTVSGDLEVDVDPVEVPFELDYQNVKRVSITMPRPTSFDKFGRPVS